MKKREPSSWTTHYGLMAARAIVRKMKGNMKGQHDAYAKGYRRAIAEVDLALTEKINEGKSEGKHAKIP